jgi:hypothetical protein
VEDTSHLGDELEEEDDDEIPEGLCNPCCDPRFVFLPYIESE